MVPVHDPIVVYAMVTALIVALAVGIFFATPLRHLVTGPDEPTHRPAPREPPQPSEPAERESDGPWSTKPPVPDEYWPEK